MTEQEAKTIVTGDLLVYPSLGGQLCLVLGQHKDDQIYDPTLLFKVLISFHHGYRVLRIHYNWLDKL